jgi:hypothetical protein
MNLVITQTDTQLRVVVALEGSLAPALLDAAVGHQKTPQSYGAAGDGVTDDSAAFQAAVSALAAQGGGTLLIGPGTYIVPAQATLPANVCVAILAGALFRNPDGSATSPFDAVTDGSLLTGNFGRSFISTSDATNQNAYGRNTAGIFLSVVHKATGPTFGSYERMGSYLCLEQQDNSSYGAPQYLHDSVGQEVHNRFGAGVTLGRIWAYDATCIVPTGTDGYVNMYEGTIVNSGMAQPSVDTPTTKYGSRLIAGGTANSTAAFMADGNSPAKWQFGFVAMARGIAGYAFSTISAGGSVVYSVDPAGNTATQDLKVNGNAGFFGHAPAAKPIVSGSRASGAAWTSLLAGLVGLGLVTDGTSA